MTVETTAATAIVTVELLSEPLAAIPVRACVVVLATAVDTTATLVVADVCRSRHVKIRISAVYYRLCGRSGS